MTKRNFGFEKRQKELAKKQKREAKQLRRLERSDRSREETSPPEGPGPEPSAD